MKLLTLSIQDFAQGKKEESKAILFQSPLVSVQLSVRIEQDSRLGFHGWELKNLVVIICNMQLLATSLSRVRTRRRAGDDHDNHITTFNIHEIQPSATLLKS